MNEDKASRYQRLRRHALLANVAVTGGLLLVLVVTGGATVLRDAAAGLTGGAHLATAAVFTAAVAILRDALSLPFAFFRGVTLERRYGLSRQSVGRWWLEHLRTSALGLLAIVSAGVVTVFLAQSTPTWWWLAVSAIFTGVLILLTQLAPMLIVPVSGGWQPLRRDALVARLMRLAKKANARVLGVFEWRIGGTTRKANAALTGIGQTRRILVSDTLLVDHSDDEIEVILAHELAHHVHHDIWTGIAVKSVVTLVACASSACVLAGVRGTIGPAGSVDAADLPLLALSFGSVWCALTPLMNAVSRAHERRADDYALTMTGNAAAFVSAVRKLAANNLADDRPSLLIEYLFYTHPPVGARIAAAYAWSTARDVSMDHRHA